MPSRLISTPAKAPAGQRTGALHHIRRSVLLLLGINSHAIHSGVARYARETNWILDDTYMRAGLVPTWWRGDGILALITNPKDARALRHLPDRPLVDLSKGWISDSMPLRYRAAGRGVPRVLYNNVLIGRMAAEHFIERGFKHIAYFNGGNYWMETERIPPFRQAVEAAGGCFHEIQYYHCFQAGAPRPLRDSLSAHRWLIKSLRQLPKPVGIALPADGIALRAFRACDDASLSVPEEVALLGCHNEALLCDYAPVPLSSVDDDMEGLGYEGAKLLDQIMSGKPAPREPILLPPKGVVTRVSTNLMAVADVRVARALNFIRENLAHPIGAPQVIAAAGVSRRALERAFNKHIGRNIAEEILHVRVEHARSLLLKSALKAHEIAIQSGFGGISQFSRAFRRVTGMPPSSFRKEHQE